MMSPFEKFQRGELEEESLLRGQACPQKYADIPVLSNMRSISDTNGLHEIFKYKTKLKANYWYMLVPIWSFYLMCIVLTNWDGNFVHLLRYLSESTWWA